MTKVEVLIEYCGGGGYEPRAIQLRDQILEEAPDVKVKIEVGRAQSFEVTANGALIFSKFETRVSGKRRCDRANRENDDRRGGATGHHLRPTNQRAAIDGDRFRRVGRVFLQAYLVRSQISLTTLINFN